VRKYSDKIANHSTLLDIKPHSLLDMEDFKNELDLTTALGSVLCMSDDNIHIACVWAEGGDGMLCALEHAERLIKYP
jgi:hypothetical protein